MYFLFFKNFKLSFLALVSLIFKNKTTKQSECDELEFLQNHDFNQNLKANDGKVAFYYKFSDHERFMITATEYLQKVEMSNNPWKDIYFSVSSRESYVPTNSYFIRSVNLLFFDDDTNNKIIIRFNEDFLLGVYVCSRIICNHYGWDPNTYFVLDKKKFLFSTFNFDQITVIKSLINCNIKSIAITFSNDEDGKNAYDYNKQLVYFVEDYWHDTFYYYNKEISKRNK